MNNLPRELTGSERDSRCRWCMTAKNGADWAGEVVQLSINQPHKEKERLDLVWGWQVCCLPRVTVTTVKI